MAKTSTLREFQESILLKLKEANERSGNVSTSRLGVTVGARNLLVNLSDVSEVLPVPPLQTVPLTQPWFLGVANVRGNLYNISDVAHFIGAPPTKKSAKNRIILLSSDVTTQVALMIDNLVGLRSIEAMQLKKIYDDNNTNEDHVFLGKQEYIDVDGNEWFELNITALLQDAVFIQPALG